jgi:uncharacterized membrane protein
MSPIAIILIVVLLVVVLGGGWGYRSGYYGNYPGYGYGVGLVGLVILVLLILLLMGRIG